MKKFYEVFLTYPNGAVSHYRKSHDLARIIKELTLLIAQRELLDELANKITVKYKGAVLYEGDSKGFNEDALSIITLRRQGGKPQYPNKITLRVSDEMKGDIEVLGSGSFSDGIREMYEYWAKKNKAKARKSTVNV